MNLRHILGKIWAEIFSRSVSGKHYSLNTWPICVELPKISILCLLRNLHEWESSGVNFCTEYQYPVSAPQSSWVNKNSPVLPSVFESEHETQWVSYSLLFDLFVLSLTAPQFAWMLDNSPVLTSVFKVKRNSHLNLHEWSRILRC